MKFLVMGRIRPEATPDDHLRMIPKFAEWSPSGYSVEAMLISVDGRLFTIAEAGSIADLAQTMAEFAPILTYEVVAVEDVNEVLPRMAAGYEWARA